MGTLGEAALVLAFIPLFLFVWLFWGWVALFLALRKHRTKWWFLAGALPALAGSNIIGAYVAWALGVFGAGWIAMLPGLEQHCPRCKARFKVGDSFCPECAAGLLQTDSLARLGGDIGRFDLQCTSCQRPYSLADYRADAPEIFCSWCKAPLPREPAPLEHQPRGVHDLATSTQQ